MLPLVLDVRSRRIAVVGRGRPAQARYEFVRDGGAERLSLYVIDQDGWVCHAEAALYERLPVAADLAGAAIAFIAGLPAQDAARIAGYARQAGALVNVEDMPELCDFHVPSVVRRGDFLLTASTGGKAPGLSKHVGAHLQETFGPEWAQRARKVIEARTLWRAEGRSNDEVSRLTSRMIESEGWLRERAPA